MAVFWSILFYTSIVSFFGSTVNRIGRRDPLKKEYYSDKKNISLFCAILTFALLLFFVGCRSLINDTYLYRDVFENYISGDLSQIIDLWNGESKSKYFYIVQVLFKHFVSDNYTVFFFALGIFQIGAIIKLFYKYSDDYFMSSYLFITSGAFIWLMGGVRQFLAVTIVLYGIEYLIQRRTTKFMIIVLIAALFHVSALLWIPVYFVCTSKPWSLKIMLFILGIASLIVFMDSFTSLLDEVLVDTNYSELTDHFQEGNGGSFLRFLVSCVPWVLAFVCRKQVEEENNLFLDISINLSVISSSLYLVAMFTSGIIVGRLPIFFMLTNYLLLPWLLNKCFSPSIKFLLKLACIILYFIYFYYDMVIKGTGKYGSELLDIAYVW